MPPQGGMPTPKGNDLQTGASGTEHMQPASDVEFAAFLEKNRTFAA